MEGKKLITVFVWAFLLTATVMVHLEGYGLSFAGYLMFFFIALVSSFAVETLIPEKEKHVCDIQKELWDMRARLDALSGRPS